MDLTTSAPDGPVSDLDRATRLSSAARRSTRWYRNYLLVFAAASFLLSSMMGLWAGPVGAAVITGGWLTFVAVSSVWVARRPTAIRGMTRLHLVVMLGWTVAWALTVVLGSVYFRDQPAWWLLGGVVVAAGPLAGAVVAHRRTA